MELGQQADLEWPPGEGWVLLSILLLPAELAVGVSTSCRVCLVLDDACLCCLLFIDEAKALNRSLCICGHQCACTQGGAPACLHVRPLMCLSACMCVCVCVCVCYRFWALRRMCVHVQTSMCLCTHSCAAGAAYCRGGHQRRHQRR